MFHGDMKLAVAHDDNGVVFRDEKAAGRSIVRVNGRGDSKVAPLQILLTSRFSTTLGAHSAQYLPRMRLSVVGITYCGFDLSPTHEGVLRQALSTLLKKTVALRGKPGHHEPSCLSPLT